MTPLREERHRRLLERLLPNDFYFRVHGYCTCCEAYADFVADHPWLRDSFQCTTCRSVPRNRALMYILEKHYPAWRHLAIHESSPSGDGASATLKRNCAGYVSSQFFASEPLGTSIGEHRNEDLGSQTFDDETFDVVVTQDVIEHLIDPASAFREIARTLRPGGAHVFSLPLVNKHRPTEVRAYRDEHGATCVVGEPEYHGNPIDPAGALVTRRWGFDIVDFIRDACGLETTIEDVDELSMGIRAEFTEVLVTRKPVTPESAATPVADHSLPGVL